MGTQRNTTRAGGRGRLLKRIAFSAVVVVVLLVLLEGLAGWILMSLNLTATQPVAERLHTEFDSELGWINRKNVAIPDMYGPGRPLHTNSQRFRAATEYPAQVAPGRIRVVCSGDSYTLGFGVGDEETWCHLLGEIDPRIETINMGQGGYGIDQAYLWYERDGLPLDHDLLVFAFITEDFLRLQSDSFLGYGKPELELVDGQLATRNVPVPRHLLKRYWARYGVAVQDLSLVRLMRRVSGAAPVNETDDGRLYRDALEVSFEIFRRLHELRDSHEIVPVLVFLPTTDDLLNPSETLRRRLASEVAEQNWNYVDLVEEFQRLPKHEAAKLFIDVGELEFRFAQGHYNEEGNRYVARTLYDLLRNVPEIAIRLADSTDPDAQVRIARGYLARGEIEAAERHGLLALEASPTNADAATVLGDVWRERGDAEQASRHYRQALSADPQNTTAHNNLGTILHRAGRLDEAISHYRQAIAAAPDDFEAVGNLASALLAAGRSEESIPYFRRALALGQHPLLHFRLSTALSGTGHPEEAREHLLTAIELARQSGNEELVRQLEQYAARPGSEGFR